MSLSPNLLKLKSLCHAKAASIQGGQWLLDTDDATYNRYLRGHNDNVDVALALMTDCAKWRKEFELDHLMDTWPTDDSIEATVLRGYVLR